MLSLILGHIRIQYGLKIRVPSLLDQKIKESQKHTVQQSQAHTHTNEYIVYNSIYMKSLH